MASVLGRTNGQDSAGGEDKAGVLGRGNISSAHGYRDIEGKFKRHGIGPERKGRMEKQWKRTGKDA